MDDFVNRDLEHLRLCEICVYFGLRFVIAVTLILVCTSCSGSEDISSGKAAIRRFHEELNAGLADEIYRATAQEYQGAATAEMNRKLIETVRKKMGKAAQF